MIPRHAYSVVVERLAQQPAVAVIGPRQVGKTTLALAVAEGRTAAYLDLENPNDRAKLQSPALYLSSVKDRLVILDEIHRVPDLFPILRGVIDEGRREGRRSGRFLLLGSASLELMRQSGETLAGRVAYVKLSPLNLLEVLGHGGTTETLWVRGGFPDSFVQDSDAHSLAWRRDFIRTYLERDIPMFGPRVPAETMSRLWTMIAHRQGGLLNASSLAQALEVSAQSVTRYIDLLCDLLLVRRLMPYSINVGKRLVKSPKVYIRDSGVLHALLNISTLDDLLSNPIVGMSWEGFAIENMLASLPWRTTPFFYRTTAGAELDLLLEFADGRRWAIEVKRTAAPAVSRGMRSSLADLQPERSFVVHAGAGRFPIDEGIEAIGIVELCHLLRVEGEKR